MEEHGVLDEFRGSIGVGGGGRLYHDFGWREGCEGSWVEDFVWHVGVCERVATSSDELGGMSEELACGCLQQRCANTWLQAYLYEHDNRFFVGWALGKSWILCTVSWIVLGINASGVLAAAYVLPPEDDYEMIPEPQ